ncbi:uncharacterized protein VTP21DRAFT_4536 [Calcarisporiella thermophila]|uniref:uncharacterized protein n=1 Tax=Calcarisporiella thermophila TaxID=911321 RepID=UPI003744605C
MATKGKQELDTDGQKVKVVCRVRPFLKPESSEAENPMIQVEDTALRITNPRNPAENLVYHFSSCYGETSSQKDIFDRDVKPVIEQVYRGLDATVFSYGVTGSGKTHTIQGSTKDPGIIPRTVQSLMMKKKRSRNLCIDIRISYMEIYKEHVFDLLIPRHTQNPQGLPIREDGNRNVFVADLTERDINSYDDFEKLFNQACKNRSTASTKLNSHSSRSHAILFVYVDIEDKKNGKNYSGKISLIDLAGSEDNRRTGNVGKERMTESGSINKSLFVLGQVVEALNCGSTRIPYRDSKMTRILQHSLGGKSVGMMIVNIAPEKQFYMDTYNTLNFATKSKNIENKPVINEPTCAKQPNRSANLGKPARAIYHDENQPITKLKRQSSSSVESERPLKKQAVGSARVHSSAAPATERKPLQSRPIQPVRGRALAVKSSSNLGSTYSAMSGAELERMVTQIVEKKMKEINQKEKATKPQSQTGPSLREEIYSEMEHLNKLNIVADAKAFNSVVEKMGVSELVPLEPLKEKPVVKKEVKSEPKQPKESDIAQEFRADSDAKTDAVIAGLLTPETKSKTAVAHVRLAKKAHKEGDLKLALDLYEKASVYMPENEKLHAKILHVREELEGVRPAKRKRKLRQKMEIFADNQDDEKENRPLPPRSPPMVLKELELKATMSGGFDFFEEGIKRQATKRGRKAKAAAS